MPAVTIILTVGTDALAELPRTVLSITAQHLRDWQLCIVHAGESPVAGEVETVAARDSRISGHLDLSGALASATAPVVCFIESGARYPIDYLTSVVAALADKAVKVTVARRVIEDGPGFARRRPAAPGEEPTWSQVAVRREQAHLPLELLLALPGRIDLQAEVITRFAGADGGAGQTVIAEISEATPPLSVKPQLAALVGADIPVIVTLVGPVRLPSRLALGKWLRASGITALAADTSASARSAALAKVETPIATFLPAGWECDADRVAGLAQLLASSKAAAVMPVARDAGGSILGAGMIWADGGSLPQRLLQGHPRADVGPSALRVPSPHPEGLTVRAADLRPAPVPAPWWPIVALSGRSDGPFLVDGTCDLAIPRFTPVSASGKGRRGNRPLTKGEQARVLAAAPSEATASSREVLASLGFGVVGVEPDGARWRPVLSRVTTAPVTTRRWALKIGAPPGLRGDPWGDVFFADDLAAALRRLGNDVVIDRDGSASRSTKYLDSVVLNIRGYQVVPRQPGAVNLLWIISHPDDIPGEEMRGYDRVYAASASWPAAVRRTHGVAVQPLLQATNPVRFHPDVATPDTGPDLLFVGNSRHQFRPIVADCRAAGLSPTVIGRDWEQFLPAEEIAALSVPNTDLPATYRAAGIVLNDHWGDMLTHGFLNNRLFDAVACGARVVSDGVPGLQEVFGDAVAVYSSVADLARLCDPANRQLFGDDARRRQRAAEVANNHSFEARARQLMADAARIPVLP